MLAPAPAEFRSVFVVLRVARSPRQDAIIRSYFYRRVDCQVCAEARIFRRVQNKASRWWPRYGPVTLLANIRGFGESPTASKYTSTRERLWYEYIIWRRAGPRLESRAESSGLLRVWMLLRTTAMSQLKSWSNTWEGLREQMRLCSLAWPYV